MPDQVGGLGVLGSMVSGDLFDWARQDSGRLWFTYPPAELSRHGVIVGAAGSGKTETLLRVGYLAAAVYGWRVMFLDAKGDTATRDRFVAAMLHAGLAPGAIRTFPRERYDGWRGDARALINRLMEVTDYSEPYYREMALRVLDLAIAAPAGLPRSSADLLGRLTKAALRAAYRGLPQAGEIEDLAGRDVAGVANRYRAFFAAVGRDRGGLDGTWSFDDASACYVLLEGLALKAEAARLGRFFLEDFAHFAGVRKAPGEPVLLIIDEFSALESTSDAANLFERLRSFNASVIVSAQGYAGLGEAADRILDAAQTLILHRCGDPERLIARAGTLGRLEHTRYLGAGPAPVAGGRQGAVTRREGWRVRPNNVRQLPVGEAVVISCGRAARVQVGLLSPPVGLLAAARAGRGDPAGPDGAAGPPPPGPRPAPVFRPSPPPAVPGL